MEPAVTAPQEAAPAESRDDSGVPKTSYISLLIASAALVVSLIFATAWANSLVLTGIDLLSFKIGIWGLVVTCEGFIFTLYQLYKTKSVAFSTQTAIAKIKRDFQALDIIVELSNARNEARVTQDRLLAADWPKCASGYQACRTALDKCVAAGKGLNRPEIEALKDFQTKFIFAEKLLNKKSLDADVEVEVDVLSGDLTEFSSFVVNLEYTIRSRFGG